MRRESEFVVEYAQRWRSPAAHQIVAPHAMARRGTPQMDGSGLPGKVQVARGGGAMSQKFYKLPVEIAGRRDLTPASKIVWAVLSNRIGDNGFCWAGVRSIAKDAGVDVSTVLESVRKLEDAGRLRVERRGSGRANHYSLPTSESAGEIQALEKSERWENPNSGAGKIQAQALGKSTLNKTEPLKRTNSMSISSLKDLFEEARKLYPGDKRGLDTEFENLKRKHKDWQAIVPALEGALDLQMARRAKMKTAGEFVPSWKNFRTYINQRCWESKNG